MAKSKDSDIGDWEAVAGKVQGLLKDVINELQTTPPRTADAPPLFPGGIGEISVIVKVGPTVGVDVEVTVTGVKNVPGLVEGLRTQRNINVCDDGPLNNPGDPITWHNLRSVDVTVFFDIDGCPLDECPSFGVKANGQHTNYVVSNAKPGDYHYRVDPACTHGVNAKITIQ